MDEFRRARLKLTLWYIIISTVLLWVLSLAAIGAQHQPFESLRSALGPRPLPARVLSVLEQRIENFEQEFIKRLLIFDLAALAVVAVASYFLSGITLRPIQEMMKKQQDFAADASHELRTPLTTISMEIEALKRDRKGLPTQVNHTLLSIKDEVRRMTKIVDGLLALVRSQSLSDKQFWQVVDLSDLVEESVRQMAPLAEEKAIKYQSQIKSGVKVRGMSDSIKQVVLILIDNAVKFSTKKDVVKINLATKGGGAILEVDDSGPGISSSDQQKIFERFYRADQSAEHGNGLGLAIAKKVIEEHDGRISVESQLKKGSKFIVWLPLAKRAR